MGKSCEHKNTQTWTIWGQPDKDGVRKGVGEETRCTDCGQRVR